MEAASESYRSEFGASKLRGTRHSTSTYVNDKIADKSPATYVFTSALTQNGKKRRRITKGPLTGLIIKPGEDKGRRMLAASLVESDPLGQVRILGASRLRKEKAALERPNYHLTAETPALVHAVSVAVAAVAGVAAAWQ